MHRHFTLLTARMRNAAPVLRKKETNFIGRLRTGDALSWSQLITHWSPYLYSYVDYNTLNEAETRKLVHNILSEVVQTVLRLPRPSNLTVLIFAIAYNHIMQHRRQNPAPLSTVRYFTSSTMIDNAAGINFLRSFRQFSLEMQQALLLRYLCGVTLPELSQIVGQPEELLTKLIQRAKFAQ